MLATITVLDPIDTGDVTRIGSLSWAIQGFNIIQTQGITAFRNNPLYNNQQGRFDTDFNGVIDSNDYVPGLNSTIANTRVLNFSVDSYPLNTGVSGANAVVLQGSGQLPVFLTGVTINGYDYSVGDRIIIDGTQRNNSFGFRFDAPSSSVDIEINDVRLQNLDFHAIQVDRLNSGQDFRVTNSVMASNGLQGIALRDLPTGGGEVTITGNAIGGNQGGVAISDSSPPASSGAITVSGNTITENAFAVSIGNGVKNVTVTSNPNLLAVSGAALLVGANTSNISITDNTSIAGQGSALAISVGNTSNNIQITDNNVIATNSGSAISLGTGSTNVSISGSAQQIQSLNGSAILVGSGSSNVNIFDNGLLSGFNVPAVVLNTAPGATIRLQNNVYRATTSTQVLLPIDRGNNGIDPRTPSDGILDAPRIAESLVTLAGGNYTVPVQTSFDTAGQYTLEVYRLNTANTRWERVGSTTTSVGAGAQTTNVTVPASLMGEGAIISAVAIGKSGVVLNVTSEFGFTNTNGFFIADSIPPTVSNVFLGGSSWNGSVPFFSSAARITGHNQTAPIATQGATQSSGINILVVHFSESVSLTPSSTIKIYSSDGGSQVITPSSYSANPDGNSATHDHLFLFSTPLPSGKYVLEISDSVTDARGKKLDAEWGINYGTLDNYSDDFHSSRGNGVQGGSFKYRFSILYGDVNGDGVVNANDKGLGYDVNGDGINGNSADDARIDAIIASGERALVATSWRGDFFDDDIVDAQDYQLWALHYGATVTPGTNGDGNGDGSVDAADYTVWRDHWNEKSIWSTAATVANFAFINAGSGEVMADFNGNGVVDFADYQLWQSTYGSTTNLLADANEDGIVDELDYGLWVDTFGSTATSPKFGLLAGMFGGDVPPSVVGFALSTAGGSAFDFTKTLGSGEQIRSVPLSSANQISITFSEDVVASQGSLQVYNVDGSAPTVTGFAYEAGAQTATWTFSSAFGDGRYLAVLSDSVYGPDSNLDGEFWNAWSLSNTGTGIFPTGDGEAGGDFRFHFTVLSGDTNHDNVDGSTDYTNWTSTEPGAIYVSTTTDEVDSDLSFGDVSLREAVKYANANSGTTIYLPAGYYALTRFGEEANDASYGDLDILGDVKIVGAGPGLSQIVPGAFYDEPEDDFQDAYRAFHVEGAGAKLTLTGVTISNALGYGWYSGGAIYVKNHGELVLTDSAIVSSGGAGPGVVVVSLGGDVAIRRSVFTNLTGYDAVAVHASPYNGYDGSLTIGSSIFALNDAWFGSNPNVAVAGMVALTNEGNNRYDSAGGGFFDTTSGVGDYLGSPDYVVTTVADTFDHSNNGVSLSVREAVDLANQSAGADEIWLPAWRFMLTRDRQTYGGGSLTDTSVAFGDLDIKGPLTIRGIADRTRIEWKPGVVDAVFDLLGDYNKDGLVDAADYTVWGDQNNSGSGTSADWEVFTADGDDDGDVDADDHTIWSTYYGNSLDLFDLAT